MDKRKIKKLLILNLPYFLVGLFTTNLGESWRLAEGADSSAKILSFFILKTEYDDEPLSAAQRFFFFRWHSRSHKVGIVMGEKNHISKENC